MRSGRCRAPAIVPTLIGGENRPLKKGFFAWLFRRRRGRDDFEPTLAHALASSAGSGLARAFEREIPMQAAAVTIEELVEQVGVRSPGWLASWFTDSDAPELSLVIPDSWSAGVTPLSVAQAEKGLPAAVAAVCANAADFLLFDAPSAFHRYFRRYGSGDIALLEWRLSGMRALRLVAGDTEGPSLFACVREETALLFEGSLREDRRKQDALRAFLALRRETGRRGDSAAPRLAAASAARTPRVCPGRPVPASPRGMRNAGCGGDVHRSGRGAGPVPSWTPPVYGRPPHATRQRPRSARASRRGISFRRRTGSAPPGRVTRSAGLPVVSSAPRCHRSPRRWACAWRTPG